jgi:hypothetical protein
MKNPTRFTLSLAAAVALFIGLTTTDGAARARQPGAYVTANGFRVPLYGMYLAKGADGGFETKCDHLTQDQIDNSRFGRSVSRAMALRSPHSSVQAVGDDTAATFEVIYTDADGQGFNDPQLGPQRKRALEAALAAWSKVLQGTIPIVIAADMPKPDTDQGATLAQAGPAGLVGLNNLAMPTSLASQIANQLTRTEASDIEVTFNPTPIAEWDYALDGKPAPNKVSFVATTIHEIAHGLGFINSYVSETGEILNPGFPFPFDTFLNRGAGGQNRLTRRTADQVKGDLISRDLFFAGPQAVAASLKVIQPLPMPKLHAPDPFEPASSIGHFDEETYTDVSLDMMTPESQVGTGDDKIDPLTRAAMQDMGYKLMPEPVPTVPTRRR